jgi:hypothetical protein
MEITGVTYSVSDYENYKKNGDVNYFEEVVDAMILDGVEGMNESFRRAIMSLDKSKKRIAILSLLDKDRNLFKRIKALTDKNINKMDHIKDIILMLREYVKVGEVEKKKFGEVMTPLELVKEMLATLPEEVWSNPNLKWLDPANGTGPYPIMVIYKLMKGLESWEPDAEKRYKHIVENMIYVCEIQPKNMFLYMCAIDPFDAYKLNIYTGSFLEEGFNYHMKEVWDVDNFDIVMGNPPFNSGQNASGKRGGGDTLWDKFVIKTLNNILKENGYLNFVHPTLWRKPQSERSSSKEVNELMMRKQIHYLEMHDSNDGVKVFNAGTRYDFYLLENCNVYTTTKINDEDRIITNIDLNLYSFIPNKGLEFFNKILANKNDERCPIIFNRTNYGSDRPYVTEVQDDIHIYRLIHSTPKAGNRYLYSSRNDRGHFGIPKVIFGESGIYDVIIDMTGEYGMSQGAMAIVVSDIEEANNIKTVLLSDVFSKFLESVMWSNFRIDWRLFTFLKKDFWREFL